MKNNVVLLGYYGGDKTHALSAWQSTGVELGLDLNAIPIDQRTNTIFDKTISNKKKSYEELLKMLAEAKHETPFEKSTLHFEITGDIASHIHCLKHRIGVSINSESARYKKLENKHLIPSDWVDCDIEDLNHPIFKIFDPEMKYTWADILNSYANFGEILYDIACKQLSPKLGRKRAKESARFFLPYSKQLNFDMQFNFRSFMHFQELRNSPHAQKEIQEIAQMMLEQVKEIPDNPFEYSLKAFGY